MEHALEAKKPTPKKPPEVVKEPHKMTQSEYIKEVAPPNIEEAKRQHRVKVSAAVTKGLPVSKDVLETYRGVRWADEALKGKPYRRVKKPTALEKILGEKISYGGQIRTKASVIAEMQKQGMYVGPGSVITYVVEEGKGRIRDKAVIADKAQNYDPEYYVNNQIVPAVEKIFEVIGYTKEDLTADKDQSKLGRFMNN